MIKIIKLDPKKDQELIKEIDSTFEELFKTYDCFMDDFFGKSFKQLFSNEMPEIKKDAPELKPEMITLGELIDRFFQKDQQKSCKSNHACKQNNEVEEDYSNVKNIDHVI